MPTLKNSLTKGLTTINVKTNNFMEQSKCKTYILTLKNEIKELKLQLGERYYNNSINNEPIDEEITRIVETIAEKYEEIKLQQDKIQKLSVEERQILGTQQSTHDEDTLFCSQCGTKNAVTYRYCCSCGAALK